MSIQCDALIVPLDERVADRTLVSVHDLDTDDACVTLPVMDNGTDSCIVVETEGVRDKVRIAV